MARLKLMPLAQYSVSVQLPIRITDINYGGHLGNDRLLGLIHEARISFLAVFGYTEHDCGGVALTVADTAVQYKAEAFAGEVLNFEMAPGEYSKHGFRLFTRVVRDSDKELIALAENGIVCLHHKTRKLHAIPEKVKAAFKRGEN